MAYEPVWAIGTGRAATAEGANAVLANVIRPSLADLFGESFSHSVRILYGGSVYGSNAAEFFAQPEIDGELVGGTSLKVSRSSVQSCKLPEIDLSAIPGVADIDPGPAPGFSALLASRNPGSVIDSHSPG